MTTLVAILDLTTLAAILDLNNFSCFWSTSHHNSSYQVSSQLAFRFRIEVPNRFSRCQFPVNWPYGSAAEVDNRLTRWRPWWPPSISNHFWSTSHLNTSNEISSRLAFRLWWKIWKQIFKMAAMVAMLDLLPTKSIGLSIQQKFKIDSQDGCQAAVAAI